MVFQKRNNYRPVRVRPAVSKILERLMQNLLTIYIGNICRQRKISYDREVLMHLEKVLNMITNSQDFLIALRI